MKIAIDGPAGAGKSTIAKRVAAALSYVYIDTGAMYRAMAVYLLRNHVDVDDWAAVSAVCDSADISIDYVGGEQVVLLGGENVTPLLRTQEVGNMASACSTNPDVRRKLVELQQALARTRSVVMDGRDIGTVVLPDAPVKIYLTASVEERTRRRCHELELKGEPADPEEVRKQIEERDYRDMNREHSPLRQADDAVLVDSSDMSIEEVTEEILRIVREKSHTA